jgi:hypothetical protein
LKILYLDINASFLNPTRSLILPALMEVGEVHAFGPGFVSSETLARGLDAYIETEGPFDVAITNTHILFADAYAAPISPAPFLRSYSFAFPPSDILELPNIASTFDRLSIPRIGIFLESDYYNWRTPEIDKVESRVDCAIAFGPEFTPEWHLNPELRHEAFGKSVTDAWPSYVRRRPDRIASLFHFVADTEFSFDRLKHRPHGWSVLGINYSARRVARDTLKRAGICVGGESPVRRGIGLAKKLKLLRGENRRIMNFLNIDFYARLASSRYSYTCGSALRMPIRKFVEIPAAGAVLVCQPFEGFSAAGFRDRENAICCEPSDILDAHRWLEADAERAQKIADAGRRLVWDRHSLPARSPQLKKIVATVAARRFAGAGWSNGEFAVRTVT